MTVIRTGCVAAVTLGLGIVAGCGGAPPPMHAQTDAVAAVRAAEALESASTPAAAYHLELARGELTEAETLMHQGHNEQAQAVLERAKADAQLAQALRREDQAREQASAAHSHIDQLRVQDSETSGGAVPSSTTITTTTATPPATPAPTTTTTVTTGGAAQ